MFGRVEVDVDADRHTLVIEFPSDQEFSMQMAEEPEMRELLQRALGAVIGVAPPVRFQLGSAFRPPAAVEARRLRASTAESGRRTTRCRSPMTARTTASTTRRKAPHPWVATRCLSPRPMRRRARCRCPGDLTRRLMESLGAEIVDERPAGSMRPADLQRTMRAESDLLELESSDFGLKDPELFDETDGEDDS